ncbi:Vacuolar import and degradation protein [Fasciola hepatica]|uniref:Vacuolar import and degradation protein n=1 Tax=Fasciola hepatica TaxID=6192 RepID=A0A4E0QZV6_FASHE|nr:Vacuolar import and degradation protein [Fasciola hepatica]
MKRETTVGLVPGHAGTSLHDAHFSFLLTHSVSLSTAALITSSTVGCFGNFAMLGSFSVDLFPEELPHTTITSCLHDGAVFKGTQRSKSKEYDVEVTIQEKIAGGTPLGSFHSDNFNYSSLENSGTVFMRWKEKFALPRVKEVDGASYAGFYYIGFNKWSGEIFGYYYHLDCEKFQSLQLTYKPEDAPSIFQLR